MKETLLSVIEAWEELQATEFHCVNKRDNLTPYEIAEWDEARSKYKKALTNAIYELAVALKENNI